MQCLTYPIGPLETNCYLIFSDTESVVIDSGGPPDKLLAYIKQQDLKLTHILLTHLHFDHTYGVKALVKATGAEALASEKDRFMLESEMGLGGLWGMPPVPKFDYTPIEPGTLSIAGETCKVLATPGHSPGGLSFYFEGMKSVFSGDSLFYRSIGRTDLPGGDQDTLLKSIRDQLFSLSADCIVYPGHGPSSTIGNEKRTNPCSSDFIVI